MPGNRSILIIIVIVNRYRRRDDNPPYLTNECAGALPCKAQSKTNSPLSAPARESNKVKERVQAQIVGRLIFVYSRYVPTESATLVCLSVRGWGGRGVRASH